MILIKKIFFIKIKSKNIEVKKITCGKKKVERGRGQFIYAFDMIFFFFFFFFKKLR
jgi:hypothetical protein